jgi:GDP-L-fucose synthase
MLELASLLSGIVAFEGQLVLDKSKPDGTPRKLLGVSEAVH